MSILVSFPRSATGTAQRVHLARFVDLKLISGFSLHGTVAEVDLDTMNIGVLLDVQPSGAEPIRLKPVTPAEVKDVGLTCERTAVVYVDAEGHFFGVWN